MVYLDEAGRLREHTRVDNLFDDDNRDEFKDILKRRQPDVIVIGGFSMATTKLYQRVQEILQPPKSADGPDSGLWSAPARDEETFDIPVVYVYDEVARMYQNSKRAEEEFSALSPTAKYCIGLARYAQSPLNEYAALGSDITAITFDDRYQPFVREFACPLCYKLTLVPRFPKRDSSQLWSAYSLM